MSPDARLVLRDAPGRVAALDRARPTTIGRAEGNRLRLVSLAGVADHHAVVRFSHSQGWLVCDWQSRDGTFLEGQRLQHCRRLEDGDEIQLGPGGPVLRFELLAAACPPAAAPAAAPQPAAPIPTPARAPTSVEVDGQSVAVATIRSAAVQSLPQHPHIFSWWLLLCLGGLLLLPFPLLFWPLQLAALAGWILLGSRKQHRLVLVLRDGRALRHSFANRRTALAHRNGIRKAIGQGADAP
ncbi:MAG: FHA domain-containing protein [Vulcanococcus sp.]